ncbi:hypothetical protein NC653_002168 [Populus alba x Populus x berolinensis]|uniref:Uncharacterized protein n=1 Tax=Populus alba x Populus x berolinensis TaxID=444605 RepID=A0AAD6WIU3_9ROSI|nr:hypothetical protein NC653_002168 [Populus alba x Populus x berolinensis]
MIQLINGKTIIHKITKSQNHRITLHSTASSCSKLHSAESQVPWELITKYIQQN